MNRILLTFLVLPAALAAQIPAAPEAITLDQAIREAVASNLDLAAEKYNISVAEARQITASLRPNPVLTTTGDHLDLLGTRYNAINNGGPNEFSVRTDFLLERGEKRAARIALAGAQKSVAELGFRDTLRRLIFDVESSFVDVQIAKEELALAQDNLRSLNGIVAINSARVQAGDLAVVELSRSQVAALQYQTAVRLAELQLRQAKNRLQLLLGRPVPLEAFDTTGPLRRDQQRIDLEEVRTQARVQRPDV